MMTSSYWMRLPFRPPKAPVLRLFGEHDRPAQPAEPSGYPSLNGFPVAFAAQFEDTRQNRHRGKRGSASMCDYSLQHLASRPAKVGDKLVTTHFKHSLTGGFCAVSKPDVALCLLPGTEVAFEREIESKSSSGCVPESSALGSRGSAV